MTASYPFGFAPATANVGARVSGIDLTKNLSANTVDRLKQALACWGVLFFDGQDISPENQLALANIFGEALTDSHPKFGSVAGRPEIAVVINDADNPPDINVWHSDTTFMAVPAGVCVLRAVEVPEVGGDTLWSSMYAALDGLSEPLRRHLSTLEAEHRLPLDSVPPEKVRSIGDREISAVHPLIRWIPEAGRASLFVNRVYTQRIIGLSKRESRGLLEMLFDIAESPDYQVRLRWSAGTIAIWDNRITQHFAAADYYPARRVMHRIALRGEKPVRWTPATHSS